MSEKNNEINEKEEENYFLEINTKSNFEIDYEKDYNYLNKLFIQKGIEIEFDYSKDFNLINEYLNSLFPNCNLDPFLTTLFISKKIMDNQSRKIRNEIYKDLDNFFQNSKKIIPNFTLSIIQYFKLIGNIFCFIYEQLNKYKIDNMQKLLDEINNVNKSKINVYDEYIAFVNTKDNWKNDSPLKIFTKKNKEKYKLPCELILLANYFKNIYTLEINYENLILADNDFLLLTITLINIDIILPKINCAKINLINAPFQSDIYSRFFRLEKEDINYSNKYIKYFNYVNDKYLFNKEIYFDREFYYEGKKDKEDNGEIIENKIENNINYDLMNESININDIIVKYKNILSSIIITFQCLQKFINMTKFDLIINENYTNEYKYLFKKYCFLNQSSNFNIINFIQIKDNIKSFNLELNFLDSITTNKLLEFIYKNKSITQLQLSLFSSKVSYIHQAIYKLFNQQKEFIKKDIKLNYIEEPETYYLNKMINYFENNLSILFDIIITKKNLSKLILYFDIPLILINNQLYMLLILKFIINILFLLDSDNYGLYILTLFAPNVALDKDICPCIEDYLDEFETYQKNESLIELNLKVQIYKIVNIKKLISTKLIILNIGDLDLLSFGLLINYLISYKFTSKSNLKKLTIGLLKTIFYFTPIINALISKLYSIKISSLLELNLITNIMIDTKNDYCNLISNLKFHWIPRSNLVLNEVSNNIIEANEEYKNNIKYLELNFLNEIIVNNGHKTNKSIECYWIFKFLFVNRLKLIKIEADKIIYGIFKYLDYETNMIITHK